MRGEEFFASSRFASVATASSTTKSRRVILVLEAICPSLTLICSLDQVARIEITTKKRKIMKHVLINSGRLNNLVNEKDDLGTLRITASLRLLAVDLDLFPVVFPI